MFYLFKIDRSVSTVILRHTLLALIILTFSESRGLGQSPLPDETYRTPQVQEKLTYIVTAADMISSNQMKVQGFANDARGGNDSGTPLGCYHICNPEREFTSEYVNESASNIAAWTYDLHSFLNKGSHRPYDIDSLPLYSVVRAFAVGWWETHSQNFKAKQPMHQAAWIYEAILTV
jgi:hypothetical protein